MDGFQNSVSLLLFKVFPCLAYVLFIVFSQNSELGTPVFTSLSGLYSLHGFQVIAKCSYFWISNTEQGNTDIKVRNMLIGLYNKCKRYENALLTWDLEAPISTLIKNLRPVWFSTRLTNTAHTYNVQELNTPWAPPEGLTTPYMSKFKVLNHNHVSWLYKQEPGNSTSRNRDVDSRTVPGLQGGLMRASRGLNENIPWGDPEGWFLSSYLWGGNCRRLMHTSNSPNSSQTIRSTKKSADKRSTDGQGAGCSPTFFTWEGWIRAHSFAAMHKLPMEPEGFNEMCSHCTLFCLSTPECFLNRDCWVTQKAP